MTRSFWSYVPKKYESTCLHTGLNTADHSSFTGEPKLERMQPTGCRGDGRTNYSTDEEKTMQQVKGAMWCCVNSVAVWVEMTQRLIGKGIPADVALLEEASPHPQHLSSFRSSSQAYNLIPVLLLSDLDVQRLAPSPAPGLHACHHASYHNNNKLNLWICTPAPIKCFPL